MSSYLYVDMNMYVTLWSTLSLKLHAVQKQVFGGVEWLRQRHHSPRYKALDH